MRLPGQDTGRVGRHDDVDGVVVAVDPAARTMLVSHRPIANYMPAMLMPFRVPDGRELAGLHPTDMQLRTTVMDLEKRQAR